MPNENNALKALKNLLFSQQQSQEEIPITSPPLPSPPELYKEPRSQFRDTPFYNIRPFSHGSESAWPTDSDYEDPSPEYLSRFTSGPLGNVNEVKQQVQDRFNREYGKGSLKIKQAEEERRRALEAPFRLR